ncbi:hypothetical protein D3OALGA1CA_3791 [Olavius algarvensis associated proteobacterium Delta 3]|nr:hypothetical protein D3OALGA1CA_3791 [Olavius algarvensis associated proteobacterium Delta 3]CAB5150063.1 hypothetical protein D3OALGB2SA_4749 [Olavius algarvensis associated proteobacterium Delta 3]
MEPLNISNRLKAAVAVCAIFISLTFIVSSTAFGHGGKTHGGQTFTAFQALQKATQLYDRLITSGKLPEDWETNLHAIKIDVRNSAEKREVVVQFEKTQGSPTSVYFFFDEKGEYSGSNFTGK